MSPAPDSPPWRWAWRAALAFAAAAGAWAARELAAVLALQDRPPLADMAKNALLGRELYLDLRALAPLELLRDLNAHTTWPFGFSLLLVPAYAAGGESFASAAVVSLVAYALVPLALVLVAREIAPGAPGLWGAALAALGYLASPLAGAFAILVMRETAGSLLVLAASWLFLRATRRDDLAAWRACGLALLALFLVKYNYALTWALAAGLDRVAALGAPERRRLARRIGRLAWPWTAGGAGERWAAASLYLAAAALVVRRGTGTVLYALLVGWSVAAAWRWRRAGAGAAAAWRRRLAAPLRALLETVVAPLWIWSLVPWPNHLRGVVDFLANRDSALGWSGGASYYLRAFAEQLTPPRGWAVAVGCGVALGVAVALRRGGGWRFLALLAVGSLALAFAHPYKQERFLLTTLAPLLLLAGLGVAAALHGGGRSAPRAALAGVVCLVSGLALGRAAEIPPRRAAAAYYGAASAPAELAPVARAVAELAPAVGRVAVLGTFNELSVELVGWALHDRGGRVPELVRAPPRTPLDAPDGLLRERVDAWLAKRAPDAVVGLVSTPASPWFATRDFQLYSRWQQRWIAELATRPQWREDRRREFPELGVAAVLLVRR